MDLRHYKQVQLRHYKHVHLRYYKLEVTPLSNIKSRRLRKSLPQMQAPSIVNRSEISALITTPILLEGGIFLFRDGDRPRGGWDLRNYSTSGWRI